MVQVSYPGVYVVERQSGVRTITGVGTSIGAFVGAATKGPIDKATRVLDYSTFERTFGPLYETYEMGFAVRQFFQNGGTEAFVVRAVKSATTAKLSVVDGGGNVVLGIEALDAGNAGNAIEVRVDRDTADPDTPAPHTFRLTLLRDDVFEEYPGATMNSKDEAYVERRVNDKSKLVKVSRNAAALANVTVGTLTGGPVADVGTVLDDNAARVASGAAHNQLRVSANGSVPVTIELAAADWAGANPATRMTKLCGSIQAKVQAAAAGDPDLAALAALVCVRNGTQIEFTSGVAGEDSSVRVTRAERNDCAVPLQLVADLPLSPAVAVDGADAILPAESPVSAILTTGTIVANDVLGLPSATGRAFTLKLDAERPLLVDLGTTAVAGNIGAKLDALATLIQDAVRAAPRPGQAYRRFTCLRSGNTLVLASGSRGKSSSVKVTPAPNDIAAALHLLGDATPTPAADVTLGTGSEVPFADADAYNAIVGDRVNRRGLYALEEVDLFNLLCLPGIVDPGILSEADRYCTDRRAFLIADCPKDVVSPEDMVSHITGTALPKTEYGAVFYPWIDVPDPTQKGRPRRSAPCGTIAGLFARTDATRGVWKAPAGTEATLVNAGAVAHVLTDRENGTLNPLGVNCIRLFRTFGVVSWGARTLRGADDMTSDYKYVPVRRLALYIEESLYRGTKWVVFEPNDEPLWAQIRLNVGAFMHGLFVQGAFAGGASAKDAYRVKCDRETTTQDDVNRGIVNILVQFAPLKPAEFVVLTIQQLAGQIQT